MPATRLALFLDIDGTLAPLVARPELSKIPVETRRSLALLQERGVAMAALSGRPLAQVRRLLYPLNIPISGSHGAQLKCSAAGSICVTPRFPSERMDQLRHRVSSLPGVWVERKPGSIAIHWRQAPEQGDRVGRLAEEIVAATPGWRLLQGHCVHELRHMGRNKGVALRRLMKRPEFAGRRPWVAGDDRTDEDAFAVATAMGGAGIRVGPEAETLAQWALPDVEALAAWIRTQLQTVS